MHALVAKMNKHKNICIMYISYIIQHDKILNKKLNKLINKIKSSVAKI